jgi:hypothetical protein
VGVPRHRTVPCNRLEPYSWPSVRQNGWNHIPGQVSSLQCPVQHFFYWLTYIYSLIIVRFTGPQMVLYYDYPKRHHMEPFERKGHSREHVREYHREALSLRELLRALNWATHLERIATHTHLISSTWGLLCEHTLDLHKKVSQCLTLTC